ncbi:uncharacterized protein LOC144744351 isoform X2 [Ciona intestinalis]
MAPNDQPQTVEIYLGESHAMFGVMIMCLDDGLSDLTNFTLVFAGPDKVVKTLGPFKVYGDNGVNGTHLTELPMKYSSVASAWLFGGFKEEMLWVHLLLQGAISDGAEVGIREIGFFASEIEWVWRYPRDPIPAVIIATVVLTMLMVTSPLVYWMEQNLPYLRINTPPDIERKKTSKYQLSFIRQRCSPSNIQALIHISSTRNQRKLPVVWLQGEAWVEILAGSQKRCVISLPCKSSLKSDELQFQIFIWKKSRRLKSTGGESVCDISDIHLVDLENATTWKSDPDNLFTSQAENHTVFTNQSSSVTLYKMNQHSRVYTLMAQIFRSHLIPSILAPLHSCILNRFESLLYSFLLITTGLFFTITFQIMFNTFPVEEKAPVVTLFSDDVTLATDDSESWTLIFAGLSSVICIPVVFLTRLFYSLSENLCQFRSKDAVHEICSHEIFYPKKNSTILRKDLKQALQKVLNLTSIVPDIVKYDSKIFGMEKVKGHLSEPLIRKPVGQESYLSQIFRLGKVANDTTSCQVDMHNFVEKPSESSEKSPSQHGSEGARSISQDGSYQFEEDSSQLHTASSQNSNESYAYASRLDVRESEMYKKKGSKDKVSSMSDDSLVDRMLKQDSTSLSDESYKGDNIHASSASVNSYTGTGSSELTQEISVSPSSINKLDDESYMNTQEDMLGTDTSTVVSSHYHSTTSSQAESKSRKDSAENFKSELTIDPVMLDSESESSNLTEVEATLKQSSTMDNNNYNPDHIWVNVDSRPVLPDSDASSVNSFSSAVQKDPHLDGVEIQKSSQTLLNTESVSDDVSSVLSFTSASQEPSHETEKAKTDSTNKVLSRLGNLDAFIDEESHDSFDGTLSQTEYDSNNKVLSRNDTRDAFIGKESHDTLASTLSQAQYDSNNKLSRHDTRDAFINEEKSHDSLLGTLSQTSLNRMLNMTLEDSSFTQHSIHSFASQSEYSLNFVDETIQQSDVDAVEESSHRFSQPPEDQFSQPPEDQSSQPPEDQFSQPPEDQFSQPPEDQLSQPPEDQFSQPPEDQFSQPPEDQFSQLPEDQLSQPPEDQSSQPPEDQFSQPPEDQFSQPPEDQFPQPPEDQFSQSPEDQFSQPPEDQFSQPPEDQFSQPPEDQFPQPPEDQFPQPPEDHFPQPPEDRFSQPPEDQSSQHPEDQFLQPPEDHFPQPPEDQFSQPPEDEFSQTQSDQFFQPSQKTLQNERSINFLPASLHEELDNQSQKHSGQGDIESQIDKTPSESSFHEIYVQESQATVHSIKPISEASASTEFHSNVEAEILTPTHNVVNREEAMTSSGDDVISPNDVTHHITNISSSNDALFIPDKEFSNLDTNDINAFQSMVENKTELSYSSPSETSVIQTEETPRVIRAETFLTSSTDISSTTLPNLPHGFTLPTLHMMNETSSVVQPENPEPLVYVSVYSTTSIRDVPPVCANFNSRGTSLESVLGKLSKNTISTSLEELKQMLDTSSSPSDADLHLQPSRGADLQHQSQDQPPEDQLSQSQVGARESSVILNELESSVSKLSITDTDNVFSPVIESEVQVNVHYDKSASSLVSSERFLNVRVWDMGMQKNKSKHATPFPSSGCFDAEDSISSASSTKCLTATNISESDEPLAVETPSISNHSLYNDNLSMMSAVSGDIKSGSVTSQFASILPTTDQSVVSSESSLEPGCVGPHLLHHNVVTHLSQSKTMFPCSLRTCISCFIATAIIAMCGYILWQSQYLSSNSAVLVYEGAVNSLICTFLFVMMLDALVGVFIFNQNS